VRRAEAVVQSQALALLERKGIFQSLLKINRVIGAVVIMVKQNVASSYEWWTGPSRSNGD
jgi:hypothetical protein